MNFVRVQAGGGGALSVRLSRGIRVRFGVRRVSSARGSNRREKRGGARFNVTLTNGATRARVCVCRRVVFRV